MSLFNDIGFDQLQKFPVPGNIPITASPNIQSPLPLNSMQPGGGSTANLASNDKLVNAIRVALGVLLLFGIGRVIYCVLTDQFGKSKRDEN